jgi:hypothetical protein
MPRAKKLVMKTKPVFSIHTISLASEDVETLRRLSQQATDFLGRSISSSAVIRALLRQTGKSVPSATQTLFLEIEEELKAGVLWGKQR